MNERRVFFAFLLASWILSAPRTSIAACAQPVTTGDQPTATDCLFVLKTAVGSESCDPCLCDIDASDTVVATDALICLRFAVGQNVTLACEECSGTTHKDDINAGPPTLEIEPLRPESGAETIIRMNVEGADEIVVTFEGQGCGDFADIILPGDETELVAAAGTFGSCNVTADVNVGDETFTYVAAFDVVPSALVLPAVEVVGGTFVPGDIPDPIGDAPQIEEIVAPATIINGGTAEVRIRLADPGQAASVTQVVVEVPDDPAFQGHYTVPAELDGDEIVVRIHLDREVGQAEALRLNLDDGDFLDFVFALLDHRGNISATVLKRLILALVFTSEVQVSLSWDTLTDLDLHLVEPGGEEIYYGNTSSDNGGVLDLDSNAACQSGGNNENISYPGRKPPNGEYIVRVDFYSNCDDNPVNYTLTRTVCGETKRFPGSFAPGEEDFGGEGSGREITRFNVDCDYRVRGKATYEDLTLTSKGLLTKSRMLAIRDAKLEVRRSSDNEILAEGNTKHDGSFDVNFKNDGPPSYFVAVVAKQDDNLVNQEVVGPGNAVYAVASDPVNALADPDKTDLKIEAKKDGPAAAFNIFDQGIDGAALFRQVTGKTPPKLRWIWVEGEESECGKVSCYSAKQDTVFVTSAPEDPDEYDDTVLLHEYGHFFVHHASRQKSGGGRHSADLQVSPGLAWAEGAATYFGNIAAQHSIYLDTGAGGVVNIIRDLDELPAEVPLGTEGNKMDGKLSTAIVTGVLWDLADSTDEPLDTVRRQTGVFAALQQLKVDPTRDRGAKDVDLVDFLDAWFCKGLGERGDSTTGVEAIVRGLQKFPYDFAEVTSCQ